MDGILLIDKPEGMTSARVVAVVKRRLAERKVGHTGTLDPFATGLLVCCIGQATRLSGFFLHGIKTYEAVLCLGVETDTQDATGKVVKRTEAFDLSKEVIAAAFRKFEGEIEQKPPVYSALKHRGVPLYRLARQGKPVQKPARKVRILSLKILDMRLPEVTFEVVCSGGTYIRTLGADIGSELGCGGHIARLRRTASGRFGVEEAVTLNRLDEESDVEQIRRRVIPMASALREMAVHVADSRLVEKIRFGRGIDAVDIVPPEAGPVKIVDETNRLVAVLQYREKKARYDYCCSFHINHSISGG